MKESIVLNGVKYVKEDESSLVLTKNYVVVRTHSAGVHIGEIEEKKDKEIILKNTRRIYSWSGACSLSQLALDGVANPEKCQFSVVIQRNTIKDWIEIIPCTIKAFRNLQSVPIWKI